MIDGVEVFFGIIFTFLVGSVCYGLGLKHGEKDAKDGRTSKPEDDGPNEM
jgi:hypothetical protein